MGILKNVLDAFEDEASKDNSLIASGTLRITRGTALVAVSTVTIMAILNEIAPEVAGLEELSAWQKFLGAMAIGFIWAITSAADALARGLAASKVADASSAQLASYAVVLQEVTQAEDVAYGFRVFTPPLPVKLIDKRAADEDGWLVVATAVRDAAMSLCIVKGDILEWRRATDVNVEWKRPVG